jgi:8-oxo-dGTP diphosphatase
MGRALQKDGRVHAVVAACQDEQGRWLCIRRSRYVAAPLKVCFPGGGIEAGESQEAAVIREMREELGIAVKPMQCVWKWESPSSELTLWGWIAERQQTEITFDPQEVAEVLWLSGQQAIEHPDAMPTNRSFVAALEAACHSERETH